MSSPGQFSRTKSYLAAPPVPRMGVATSANASQPVSPASLVKLRTPKYKKPMERRPWPYNEIVHLKVGPDKIDFGIHKNLLCSASSWFKDVLTQGSSEAKEGVICLPDDSLETLEFFNLWLYTNTLNDPDSNKPPSCWRLLIDIYLWAGYRGVSRLQNFTIDTIRAKLAPGESMPSIMVDRTYSATPQPMKLRSLVATSFLGRNGGSFKTLAAYCDDSGGRSTLTTEIHPPLEFLYDLILLQKEKLDVTTSDINPLLAFDRCYFHVHPDGETCSGSQ
ncbi:hypothetical protein MMC30_000680 [Trapelia coarctata]|nr:hypothetical protein [Trapelia coarctata]